MKVHFHILYANGASMRCGIELPDPPTKDAIRGVARVFLGGVVPTRIPIWQPDGVEVDMLILPAERVGGASANDRATKIIRDSLMLRTATRPEMLTGHVVFGAAILVEPKVWPT